MGVHVVSDRFKHSTIAYQSAQGMDIEHLIRLHQGMLVPDITFFVDVSSEIGLSRMAGEEGKFEQEDFQKVVKSCPVPVVIAGGKKIPEKDALELAYNAIRDGAAGVDMGRNIFQSSDPAGMIKAVRSIVHENVSAKKACKSLKL